MLTKKQLTQYLESIRGALANFNYQRIYNIIFFNKESFYAFIKSCFCGEDKTIGEVMDIVEPYIPYTLDEGSIDLFLAAIMLDENEKNASQDFFTHKAKADFLFSVKNAGTPEEWDFILDICESIRQIKEKCAPVLV